MYKQEKPPGFKFLRVNSWEINHVTSKCQMYFLKKTSKVKFKTKKIVLHIQNSLRTKF